VNQSIRVLVVDDHPVFRMGMSALLNSLSGIEVVGEAEDAPGAVALATDVDADVAIVDLNLGSTSGIDATRDIVARRPQLGVLIVTMHDDTDSVVAAMRAGAKGYVLKGAGPAAVERAVRAVASGETILASEIAGPALSQLASRAPNPFPELTERELDVLELVAGGFDNATIARRLFVSPKTVRNHVSNVLTKLQVTDRAAAIVLARDAGLGRG
jgi:DNA-binding NarL/FixJ family response regulator